MNWTQCSMNRAIVLCNHQLHTWLRWSVTSWTNETASHSTAWKHRVQYNESNRELSAIGAQFFLRVLSYVQTKTKDRGCLTDHTEHKNKMTSGGDYAARQLTSSNDWKGNTDSLVSDKWQPIQMNGHAISELFQDNTKWMKRFSRVFLREMELSPSICTHVLCVRALLFHKLTYLWPSMSSTGNKIGLVWAKSPSNRQWIWASKSKARRKERCNLLLHSFTSTSAQADEEWRQHRVLFF